eukprot:COSAG01_NODE_71647_length_255_cov_0.666667_1_plen_60_part_01
MAKFPRPAGADTFNKQDDPGGGFSPDQYPCPPGVTAGSNSKTNSTGQWFCTLNKDTTGGA